MTVFCKYHPTRPAHWLCPKCQTPLCPDCILKREKGGYGLGTKKIYLCPQCRIEADWIGASNLIEPFWQRLPVFFAYPFKAQPLSLNIILTIMVVFFGWIPFFKFLVLAVLIKYAYMVLRKTVYGDLRPPAYDTIVGLNDITPVLQQWFLFFLLAVLGTFVFAATGLPGAALYALAVIFLLPAIIILLATSERISHALNPVMFIGMVAQIGSGYLLMWFFLALLFFAPSAVFQLTHKIMPPYVTVFVISFARNYYTIISYFLMGYVILQYHERLNYTIEYEDFYDPAAKQQKETAATDPQQEIIDEAGRLAKEGKPEEAVDYIKKMTAAGGIVSIVLLERFYQLLRFKKDVPAMLEQGRELIHKLIAENQRKKACQVFIECALESKAFQLAAPDLLKLSGWLHQDGKVKAAANALNKLVKYYPEDPLAPKAYFQIAQIYNEKLNDAVMSRKIIATLLKRYPDHDIVPFAERYLAGLKN